MSLRLIKIHPEVSIVGGLSRFVSSLVDFSFIRSIVAHTYKPTGFAAHINEPMSKQHGEKWDRTAKQQAV